jgi:hypothetical protein
VVAHCLVCLASARIRQIAGTTVSIFYVGNDPQEFVWLGDCGEERDFAHLAPTSGAIIEWLRPSLAASPMTQTLRLVEDYHRPPLVPYQLWIVETPAAGAPE